MSVSLQVLGSGDAFGSGGRFYSCYHVKSEHHSILLDCGATAVVSMKRYGLSTRDIDVVIISHFHGDHYPGLIFFLLDAAIMQKRRKPLTIVSPRGCEEKLKQLVELLYPGSQSILKTFPVKYISFDTAAIDLPGGLVIQPFKAKHTAATRPHSIRITVDEKVIAYTGDTGWSNNLFDLSKGADLFLCECSMHSKEFKSHLSYRQIFSNRGKFNCKKILLTHLGEDVIKNLRHLELQAAEDGKVYLLE